MDCPPDLPVAISLVDNKYFIFDIDVVSYLRREHQICGVMSGSLPQNPSQNLFLGLPMQIMPEEAQFLLEKGVGHLLDDPRAHDQLIRNYDSARHATYMANVRRKAQHASKIRAGIKEEHKKIALSKKPNEKIKTTLTPSDEADPSHPSRTTQPETDILLRQDRPFIAARLPLFDADGKETLDEDTNLFVSTPRFNQSDQQPSTSKRQATSQVGETLPLITPTTSGDLLPLQTSLSTPPTISATPQQVPNLPASYALYKHLNSKSYFTTPGLRFGCQYCVYPGDPLRFHSHFLAMGYNWEDEIDPMDIVGGGRLGTGVKKGWLIGGEEPARSQSSSENGSAGTSNEQNRNSTDGRVRTFTVEWAAM